MTTLNSGGNSIEDQHLDAIKAVKDYWEDEADLNLEDNAPRYFRLYTKGISEDDLTLKIIDKRNKENSADYFGDKDQIKRARSYARNIIEFMEPGRKGQEAPEEEKTFKVKRKELEERTDLSEEDRDKEEKKLLEEQIRKRATKQKEFRSQKEGKTAPGKTSKNPLMQDLLNRLHDIDENMIEDKGEKIDRITTVALPWIPLPTFRGTSTNQNGVRETEIKIGVMSLDYQAWVRHHRLNRVARRFNKLREDPNAARKGLNYVNAMCKKSEGGRPIAAMIRGFKSFLEKENIIDKPEAFLKQVEDQKKVFIDDITKGVERKAEQPSIDAIKKRIDYFAQQFQLQAVSKALGIKSEKKDAKQAKK